jgi:hypothetical protein
MLTPQSRAAHSQLKSKHGGVSLDGVFDASKIVVHVRNKGEICKLRIFTSANLFITHRSAPDDVDQSSKGMEIGCWHEEHPLVLQIRSL